jgi:hypothetical protein
VDKLEIGSKKLVESIPKIQLSNKPSEAHASPDQPSHTLFPKPFAKAHGLQHLLASKPKGSGGPL